MNLRELKLNRTAFDEIIPHSVLKASYRRICTGLDAKTLLSKTTFSQKQFAQILSKKSRLRFYENVWIGKRNVDFLIPCIKIETDEWKRRGVVYEIDGGIHNAEIKIRMDKSLYEQLFKLNLMVKCILNDDLKEHTVDSELAYLLKCPRMSSREKKRLWRNIYIITIYKNWNVEMIDAVFGEVGVFYIQKLGRMYEK